MNEQSRIIAVYVYGIPSVLQNMCGMHRFIVICFCQV